MAPDRSRPYVVRRVDWERDEAALRAVRLAVFVVEQNVPEELEWDGIDRDCIHAIAEEENGNPIGCGRLLPDGHVGRMAVISDWRGFGVGAALLMQLVELARARGHRRLLLNAQTHAMPFYARYGFTPVGDEFAEAGIPHRAMERLL